MKARTMLAAVYHGPMDLRVEQHPVPEINPDEALLKVISTGICGTDLRILHGVHRKYLTGTIRIPGHEVVGDLVEVGEHVKGLEVGQRIFFAPNIGCGHCPQCISGNNNLCQDYDAPGITFDGSFAEYLRVPAAAIQQGNLIHIGERIDPASAALIEPFACVLRGQDALHIQPGETVLVIGAGPIGIMHLMLASIRGAGRVIVSEINPVRREQAIAFGANRVVNPSQENLANAIAEETRGRMADVVIVAAPAAEAQAQAFELATTRGRINFFGGLPKEHSKVSLDSNLVHYKELIVTGTTGCSTNDCSRAEQIVNSRGIDLSKLVSAKYPLKEALQAFKAAEAGTSLKIIIEP